MDTNLDIIYSQYDKETVEANKKLPKPCYGNSNGYYCNYECKSRSGCYAITMQKWGVCECEFKPSCHLGRQKIQSKIKAKNSNYICGFKQYFDKETYPIVIIPNGIIKMKPIKEE